jgi:DNA segregation ATPase FtsK/SpoIIIE, S-DNA-T family
MTDVHLNGHTQHLEVPPSEPAPPEIVTVPRDTSFEVQLDETAPKPEPVHDGDGIEIPRLGGERRDIIPAHLRTWKGIKSTTGKYADAARFHTLFHLLRTPMYLVLGVLWAVVGVGRVTGRQFRWWWQPEHGVIASKAVLDLNGPEYRKQVSHVRKVRSWRGAVLGAELFAIVLAGVLIAALCPWQAWLITAAVAMPPLAYAGRPAHRPIFRSAVTTPLVRKISTDAIVRAYEVAGLCSTDPKKPADHLSFGSTMSRDALDKGSQVIVYLPYGGTFAKVVEARPKVASGLDVAESQVYFRKDKKSERRHTLLVLDDDPLAEPAGRTPLLDCKQRSVWRKFPFGLDQFGRRVAFCLMWISLLIGAQPRKGKTFAGRSVALFCALDPYVNITLIDGKSSKDWQPLQMVAHRFVQGTHPTKDGDPVEQALEALHEVERHIVHVNDELKLLPTSQCPQGKLTEHLYKRPDLHVWLLIVEEFQAYYELDNKKKAAEFARLLSYIGSQGPSAGVILESLSQKPSGVGGGDVGRMFNTFRDNHQVRFGLRCGNRDVSMAILGNESYGEGYDCSGLPLGEEYRGIGILYGLTDEAPTVRTFLADGEDAEVICLAARKIRERAGTLSGDAAGLVLEVDESDIVADLAEVFGGDPGLWWEVAAERLAATFPDRYADATGDSVRSSCAKRGVSSVDVRMPPGRDGTKKRGVRRADLDGTGRR